MPQLNDNTVILKFTPQSMQDVNEMAEKQNTSVEDVISQALGLFKIAQGKTVVLKEKSSQQVSQVNKFAK